MNENVGWEVPKFPKNMDHEALAAMRRASISWLRENYSHIWFNPRLTTDQKAGFLAACCDSRRCYLATLTLDERVEWIRVSITQELNPLEPERPEILAQLLRDTDFYLDEFGVGACATPPSAPVAAVPLAVTIHALTSLSRFANSK